MEFKVLKRFIIENFLSFNGEVVLDLTAGRGEIHPNHLNKIKNTKILKTAIVYGANASGKSNLIKAIDYGRNLVTTKVSIDTYDKFFKLDNENRSKTSKFEFEIEIDNIFFAYGFEIILNTREIKEEWLYKLTEKSQKMIFSRSENEIKLGVSLEKSSLKANFEVYKNDIKNRSNKLFLSELGEKKIETKDKSFTYINNIYKWFNEKLIVRYPESKNVITFSDDLSLYLKYIKSFDTDIIDIKESKENFDDFSKKIPLELKESIQEDISKGVNRITLYNPVEMTPYTIYQNKNKELNVKKLILIHNEESRTEFEFKEESDGTKRLFDLIPLIGKFNKDYRILIDEFDRSLHPKLTKKFFEIFYSFQKLKTQIITTTHEITLLDLKLVRRDEIFFMEKKNNGESKLFSLAEFNERYDKKIDKAYLLGRYGGVPNIKDVLDIN